LSGLLNFIDGLWSSCGDERIIVFTTNYKDKLDPALLRPGRMDMHIHMSYCTPCGLKILASNYLNVKEHSLFSEIDELIMEVEVTPAEVAEELMKNEDVDTTLTGLIGFLESKKVMKRKHPDVEKQRKWMKIRKKMATKTKAWIWRRNVRRRKPSQVGGREQENQKEELELSYMCARARALSLLILEVKVDLKAVSLVLLYPKFSSISISTYSTNN